MNVKDPKLPFTIKNTTLEAPLVTRFDFIFELIDQKSPSADEKVLKRIFDGSMPGAEDPKWTREELTSHILVAKNIVAEMSFPAQQILQNYYQFCCNHPNVDLTRCTPRLFESLQRVTKSHAKLMLRKHVRMIDALTTVMLFESSWSMGHLIVPLNVMEAYEVLGPITSVCDNILRELGLSTLTDEPDPSEVITPGDAFSNLMDTQDDGDHNNSDALNRTYLINRSFSDIFDFGSDDEQAFQKPLATSWCCLATASFDEVALRTSRGSKLPLSR